MKTRTRTRKQYRLQWLRDGNGVKAKLFAKRETAERHSRILTAEEPWREWAPEKGPNDFACCSGDPSNDCSCGGITCAQARDEVRKDLPPILWIQLDERTITTTAWEQQAREDYAVAAEIAQ